VGALHEANSTNKFRRIFTSGVVFLSPYRLKVIDLDSGEESELTAEEFLEYYGV
jgi:hypothetical protein